MKKFLIFCVAALSMMAMPACSSSDDPDPNNNDNGQTTVESKDLDYTSDNAKSWGNYMVQVASLLKKDATQLYQAWAVSYNGGNSYADQFKNQEATAGYSSAADCVSEIIEKCMEIANEVGTAKIGDPYNLYISGKTEEALYAVESWYSWHSRDDYTNNIYSIRNAYYGSLDGTVADASLSALMAANNPDIDNQVKTAIADAAQAIQDIPQPFRNNINSSEARVAMTKCSDLEDLLDKTLKPAAVALGSTVLQPVVERYVDYVVVPTYKDLMEKNEKLYNVVMTFYASPSNANFEAACDAWLVSREPWEKSEAFLFGPVDAMGLDPNMDSWPLDQDQIVQILNSGKYDDLDWTDGDDDEEVEAKQGVRGFHTLEFLIFKDGKARTVK
ncbi:MAG: peptidase M75 [Bacteroidales bacterium]|nr:peptidase M75 [Bacteroidales bacterium]